jgi:hypothetical protein
MTYVRSVGRSHELLDRGLIYAPNQLPRQIFEPAPAPRSTTSTTTSHFDFEEGPTHSLPITRGPIPVAGGRAAELMMPSRFLR